MKRKLKQAVARSLAISMLAASAANGLLPAQEVKANAQAPSILITELVPDSENIDTNDGYEYIELYNATDQVMDLTGHKIRVATNNGATFKWESALPGTVIVPPRGTVLIWTQTKAVSSSPVATKDSFRTNYKVSAADLLDDQIYVVPNVSGLYNGSATDKDIVVSLVNLQNQVLVSATYFINAVDDTVENKGISYRQPASGLAMIHNGGNKTATPGTLISEEVAGTRPSGLTIDGADRSLTLSWPPVSDSNVSGYRIYSREGLAPVTVSGSTYSHTFTNLTNGIPYSFSLSSVYADGTISPASAAVTAKPGIPPAIPSAPIGLRALPRDGAVRLSWDASTELGVAGYRVFKNGALLENLTASNTYAASGLPNGQTVTFSVYTVNELGQTSTLPSVVTAKPQAAPAVLVTEMAPNTKNSDYKTGGTDAFEFIELHNTTGAPLNLKGFTLKYIAGSTIYPYLIEQDKVIAPQGTFIIWFKNTALQHLGLTEFNTAYGTSITEDQLHFVVNGGMSNTAARRVQLLDPDNIVLTDTTYQPEDVGESITANFVPDRNNGVVSTERFSKPANPGYIYPVQKAADPFDLAPPAPPSGVQVTAGVGGVKTVWSDTLEQDVAYVKVYVDGSERAKLLMPETEAVIEGLDNGKAVSVQLSTVDTAGRESARTAPVTVTPTMDALPALMITEIVPDTWNTEPLEARDVYDAFEYIELYNQSSQPIDMNGKTVRFTQPDDATKSWSWTFTQSTVIKPKQTMVFWVRPNGLSYLKPDGFNFFYNGFQEAKYVPETEIVLADGAAGLNNSGGIIDIVEPDGTVVVTAQYKAGQFQEKKGISFAYPMFGGKDMRTYATIETGTPGTVTTAQIPRVTSDDKTAPAAPQGFQAAAGAGEATLSWQPSPDADVAGYRVYMNGQLELTLPSTATTYRVPGLNGAVTVSFELSAIDASGNESQRATASAKPTYAIMTQEERQPSPANALTESRYQAAWDVGGKGPIIPGLVQGHVPQGMSYYKDNSRDWILMAAYHFSGDPSTMAVVDAKTGELVKYVHLKNADGSIYTGHAGGVAVSKENVWLSSGKKMHRLPIQTLIDAQDGGFATFADAFDVVTNSSFAAYHEGILWVGEYSNPPSYTTNPEHKLDNRQGEAHLAWIAGYPLGQDDRLPANTPTVLEDKVNKAVPTYIMSIGDKIQGVEFHGGEVLLTYNHGRPFNRILRYAMPSLSDLSSKQMEVALGGVNVPVWMLDAQNFAGSIDVPTGSENLFIRTEDGRDQLYVNFESGANHMRHMSSYSMDRLLRLDLALMRAYDSRTLQGIPAELNVGAEAQATVLADRGKRDAENVTSAYTWTSSDPSVVQVTADGRVKAVKSGSATITAQSGTSVLTASVKVAKPDSIRVVLPENGRMTEGTTYQLAVKAVYNGGFEGDATAQAVYAVKEGSGSLEVSGTGLVRAKKPGAGILLVTFEGYTLELKVIVRPEEAGGGDDSGGTLPGNSGAAGPAAVTVPSQPKQQVLTAEALKPEAGVIAVKLDERQTELAITGDVLQKLSTTPLVVEQGNARLTLPAASLKDAAGGTAAIKLLVELKPTDAPAPSKELKPAAKAFTFGLSVAQEDGTKTALKPLDRPAKVSVPVDSRGDSRLLGLYAIQPDGSPVYVGGSVKDGVLTAELNAAGTYAVLEFNKSYTDVPDGHWANEALKVLAAKHVAQGVSQDAFAPNEPVTRAEFTALLVRAFGLTAQGKSSFEDVSGDAWYSGAIQAAAASGLIEGVEAGRFAPNEPVTREQMAVLLVRAWEKSVGNLEPGDAGSFQDASSLSGWASEAVAKARKTGLLSGKDGDRFDPSAVATRAESAQAIFNALFK
ncbi:lamin tail domain-containing protein [Paenibacillus silviterrae]|uniref:lamin tail domain-containing protein n=1 Tax=Paenibacillus silviterrae TaxID=3242194 RepID=UPI0025427BA4|nr:lamin tail domain-containing protein [Paenibacillus chinjuensis]